MARSISATLTRSGLATGTRSTINYGYRQFPAGTDETAALKKILDDAWKQDLIYMTNQDTESHPKVDQWSNGTNQADELNRLMKVRHAALGRIGEHTIRNGQPMATIEEPLVPIYMYHRYAVEAAASMVAGQDYIYGMRGDGRVATKWEDGGRSAQGARCARRDAEAFRADAVERAARVDPAATARLGHAIASSSRARPATRSIHSRRRRLPPTSRSASRCSSIAPRGWSRSTPSIRLCPASKT